MDSYPVDVLLGAIDTSNHADRHMAADALEEAGRDAEAGALRGNRAVHVRDGKVVHAAHTLQDHEVHHDRRHHNHETIRGYDWYDMEQGPHPFPQRINLKEGETKTPSGDTVSVHRWEHHQDDGGGMIRHGPWTYDEDEARQGGHDYADEDEATSDEPPPSF